MDQEASEQAGRQRQKGRKGEDKEGNCIKDGQYSVSVSRKEEST